MKLEFPQVNEIPLLVKLVSAGEQDVLPVSTAGQVLFAAGVLFLEKRNADQLWGSP